MTRSWRWLCTSLFLAACPEPTVQPTEAPPAPSACQTIDLDERAFVDPSEPPTKRRQLAADFSVPRFTGGSWSLKESWTGCDSIIILPHNLRLSSKKPESWWGTSVADLVAKSPPNVVYIFVPRQSSPVDTYGIAEAMQANVDAALADLPADEQAWWTDRLIVSEQRAYDLGNWVSDMLRSGVAPTGFAIDRFQQTRGLGGFAALDAYDPSITSGWPWEYRLYMAANEAIYFNFEVERQARLDAVDATIVEGLTGDVIQEYEDFEVTLPDAETMATFDTLEVDIVMECPDTANGEVGNCGAWDYLAHLWLFQGEGDEETQIEMARFITTYHRESRWVVDASQALAWLKEGGKHKLRYNWAPPWNKQPTGVTLRLRLSNQGKGMRPTEVIPLYTGGKLNADYNASREPMSVDLPASSKKVEFRAIITGHGAETSLQCAEFCNHGHRFTIAGTELFKDHPEADIQNGCETDIENGTVPNQNGTWWFGRGGWCPGKRVDPWVEDVTESVSGMDGPIAVSYEATVNGGAPNTNYGNIMLSSWLVVYE